MVLDLFSGQTHQGMIVDQHANMVIVNLVVDELTRARIIPELGLIGGQVFDALLEEFLEQVD